MSLLPYCYALAASALVLVAGCGMEVPQPGGTPAGQPTAGAPVTAGVPPVAVALAPADAPAGNGADTRCNIETLGGQLLAGSLPTVAAGHAVELSGWYHLRSAAPAEAGGDAAAAPPTVVVLSSAGGRGRWIVAMPARTERPDVAVAHKDPTAMHSGFAFNMDLSALSPGVYRMHLSDAAYSAASICGMGHGLVIR